MQKDIGYPLPDGDAFTEDTECMLVFLPAKEEYRRALWGALDYFGTWKAWEKDTLKRGKDAARAWKDANDLTYGCYMANTCDTIIGLLTDIRNNQNACCGESTYVTYNENTVVTTVIVPGQGTVPATWGEQALTDWSDWDEYVCGAAHNYVDDLIDTVEKIGIAATVGGFVFDFVAHLFSLVQWRMVEDIIPVNFSLVTAIVDALGAGLLGVDFGAVMDDIETSRDDIVCALMCGTSLEDAVQSAIDNQALWDAFFQWFDYESTTAAIYEGEVEGVGYLPVIQRSDCQNCDCSPPGDHWNYHFDADVMGWVTQSAQRQIQWSASGYAKLSYPATNGWSFYQAIKSETGGQAYSRFNENAYPHQVNQIEIKFMFNQNGYGGIQYFKLELYDAAAEQVIASTAWSTSNRAAGVWHTETWVLPQLTTVRANNWHTQMTYRLSSSSTLPFIYVDYIKLTKYE